MSKKEETVLQEAERITNSDRQSTYGPPEDNFEDIANLWNTYLGNKGILCSSRDISTDDVAHMMILLKIARNSKHYKRDNVVDMAGYARTIALMHGEK